MSYHETGLRKHEYVPGEKISFTLDRIQANGQITSTKQEAAVDRVVEGGFFGKVIIPEDESYVIKTSVPSPSHQLARYLNWNLAPFPAQVDLRPAQLEHLSTTIIHNLLPWVSDGKYYSPKPYGYTDLPSGYAQVVEKLEGRGPRFDLDRDDVREFKGVQEELLSIGTAFGLEQVGQIHPNNPFGMANIWRDDKNDRWIWLDTIPAIPHRGIVLPGARYPFHYEMRREFGGNTFNKIHSDRFIKELSRWESKIPSDIASKIRSYVHLWDSVWQQSQDPLYRNPVSRDFAGVGTAARETAISAVKTAKEAATHLVLWKKVDGIPMEISREYLLSEKDSREIGQALRGVERAMEHGIVSEEEYKDALENVLEGEVSTETGKKIRTLLWLQGYYLGVSFASKLADPVVLAGTLALGSDTNEAILITGAFDFVFSPILRSIGTFVTSKRTKTDLSLATKVSAIPTVGTLLAVPAEFRKTLRGQSDRDMIWHYSIRNLVARFSKIFPSGGWGTEIEAKLWKLFGARIQNLAKKADNDS